MAKLTRHLQDSPETAFRRQVLERVSIGLGSLIILGLGARYLSSPVKTPQVFVALGFALLVLLTPLMTRRLKHAALSAAPICVAMLLFVAGSGWKNGGLEAPIAAMLPMLPLVAFCFGGKRLALAVLGGTFVVTGGLFAADLFGLVEPLPDVANQPRNLAIVMSFLAMAAFVIGSVYERSRRIAEQHLVEASRLASLGVMAGGVAHEINNPLMIADSFARFLLGQAKKGEVDPKEVERLANHVVTSTTRMAAIVSGLRIYSRDDAREELAPVSVSRVVEDALALCRERFRAAGIDLRVGPIPSDLMIMGRPVQVSQILLNLLNNAFDAVSDARERTVQVEVESDAETCSIKVIDSGPGVSAAVQPKIFIPFFTTKAVGRGVGLGLSVCASIMSEHGGEVYLDTTEAKTTFVLRFPAPDLMQAMAAA